MTGKVLENYLKVQDLIREDGEYRVYLGKYQAFNGLVLELLSRLPEEDADLIMEYIGVCGAMGTRIMEIVCVNGDFSAPLQTSKQPCHPERTQ